MGKRGRDVAEQRKIGARIRKARNVKGLSGLAVAEKAQVGRYHYYVIERGETQPTTPTLGRIARALGVSIHWLLTGEEP